MQLMGSVADDPYRAVVTDQGLLQARDNFRLSENEIWPKRKRSILAAVQ